MTERPFALSLHVVVRPVRMAGQPCDRIRRESGARAIRGPGHRHAERITTELAVEQRSGVSTSRINGLVPAQKVVGERQLLTLLSVMRMLCEH